MQTHVHSAPEPHEATEPQAFVHDVDFDETTASEGGGQSTGRGSTVVTDQRPGVASAAPAQIAWVQGSLYICLGAWPLLDLASFSALAGPAQPAWALQAMGIFIAGLGAYLFNASVRGRLAPETATLGLGCALALGSMDGVSLFSGSVSSYLILDAALQAILLAAWGMSRRTPARRTLTRRRIHSTLH